MPACSRDTSTRPGARLEEEVFGLRQAEQFRLRWCDVDLVNLVLTVPRSKNGETRHGHLNETAIAILRDAPSRCVSKWVFPSRTGATPLEPHNFLHRVFVPALGRAAITGFRWHDLRHTFASRLVMAGADLPTVKDLMGHKTLAMTLRYSHLSTAHRVAAVRMLDAPVPSAEAGQTGTKPAPAATNGAGEAPWPRV